MVCRGSVWAGGWWSVVGGVLRLMVMREWSCSTWCVSVLSDISWAWGVVWHVVEQVKELHGYTWSALRLMTICAHQGG